MALLVVAFLVSLLPSIGLFLWLREFEGDPEFKGICNKALVQGFKSTIPVIACSLVLAIVEFGLSRLGLAGIGRAAFHCYVVLALSEELCKCLMFHKLLEKYERAWSWADYVILMTLVGTGFALIEDIPYAIGAGPIAMLVRGVTCMHDGWGFIMGYFLGKAKKTGNRKWAIVGVVLPWLLHGSYDFGLSEEFAALGDLTAFLSVSLAALAVVTIVVLIIFLIRHKHDEDFLSPMAQTAEPSVG